MKGLAILAIAGTLAVVSGCRIAPASKPEIPAPPPPLQLIESQPLVLAEDCVADGSFFVEFTVQRDGRTRHIQPPAGPACVQQALMAWVGSFRYSPPPMDTSSSIEWMLVTARKGS